MFFPQKFKSEYNSLNKLLGHFKSSVKFKSYVTSTTFLISKLVEPLFFKMPLLKTNEKGQCGDCERKDVC